MNEWIDSFYLNARSLLSNGVVIFRCAMAVIHSRFRRVFFGVTSSSSQQPMLTSLSHHSKTGNTHNRRRYGAIDGAFGGGSLTLHSNKQLNHHPRVFRHLLKEECEELIGLKGK